MAKINVGILRVTLCVYLNPYFFTLEEGCILNIH